MDWLDILFGAASIGCAYLVLPHRLREVREFIERFLGLRK
jgi:hypothetical protein